MDPKNTLIQTMRRNETVLQVLPAEDLLREWQHLRGPARTAANYVAPTLDAITLAKLVREMGLVGKVVIKKVGGKTYVILKGYPGKRTILRGTRYLATHPKVVRLAIGPKGLARSVKGGAVLTAVLFTGVSVLEYILRDSMTLYELLGTLSADLLKIGISSICSALAGLAVGTFAIVAGSATAPLFVAIGMGIIVGTLLDRVDERYGATKVLVGLYESAGIELSETWEKIRSVPGALAREVRQWERHFAQQVLRGRAVGY